MGLPHDPITDPNRPRETNLRVRRYSLALAALLIAAALAVAAAAGARGMWRGHHADPEVVRDHAAFMVGRMLSRVDATPEQVEQVRSIVDGAIGDLFELRGAGDEMRRDFAAALTAEEIDRSALETLRQQKLETVDAASKRIVTALVDISEVLTPAQREAVALHLAEHRTHEHRGWRR
ncbi:MAG: Spy/CpxP family protein refolding chaperone [Myxococcota bacterium]